MARRHHPRRRRPARRAARPEDRNHAPIAASRTGMKGPIARATLRTSAVLGLRLFVQAGTLLLVARLLGPHDFGAFAGVAALAVMLGTLSTFGMHLVLLGEMSRDPARRDRVMSYAVPYTLACGALLLAIFLVICLTGLQEAEVPLQILLVIGITETLLQPLLALPVSEQLAQGHIARSQLLTTLPLALRLGAVACVSLLAPTDPLTVYGYVYLAASLIALAFTTLALPAAWPPPWHWRLATSAELREAAGYAILNVTAVSPAELDKTLATKLLPLTESGVYAAAARVIGAATLPVSAMVLSALPRLFREGRSQPGRTARLLRWIFGAALTYSILLSATLWLAAPAFAWLFGTKYRGFESMMRWLCLAVPGMTLRLVMGSVLMALGKPWMRVGFEMTGLLVLLVTSVVLTARLGIIGMPLALASSEWAMCLFGGYLLLVTLQSDQRQAAKTETDC